MRASKLLVQLTIYYLVIGLAIFIAVKIWPDLRGYLPVETYSAHLIAHKGLSRAVDDFLEAERAAVAENISELARHAPFRKDK